MATQRAANGMQQMCASLQFYKVVATMARDMGREAAVIRDGGGTSVPCKVATNTIDRSHNRALAEITGNVVGGCAAHGLEMRSTRRACLERQPKPLRACAPRGNLAESGGAITTATSGSRGVLLASAPEAQGARACVKWSTSRQLLKAIGVLMPTSGAPSRQENTLSANDATTTGEANRKRRRHEQKHDPRSDPNCRPRLRTTDIST